MKKIVLIGPVYPYKGGIAHYTSLMYQALTKKFDVEMISYKMQYPRFLFRKEQKDYRNDMFEVKEAQFLIHTANPLNIIHTAHKIKKCVRTWSSCSGGIRILHHATAYWKQRLEKRQRKCLCATMFFRTSVFRWTGF